MSPCCCRHVSFFMLICPFLYAVPLFFLCSMAQVGRGSPSMSISPSCGRHVSFYSNLSFSYAVPLFFLCSMAQVGRGGLPPCLCLHPVVATFLFYASLSFSYAVPLFFLCSMAQVGRGVSLHLHVSILCHLVVDTFLFYANLSFSYAVPFFFLCSMAQVGRGSLPPSPCLHPVVDTFLFYVNLSFSYAVPPFSYVPWRRWDGGVSLHLHVSILSSTRFFFMLICPFLMLSPLFLMFHGAGGTGGLPPSPCLHPVVDTFLFLC